MPSIDWLSFVFTAPAAEAPITLTLSGPAGAREFLDALFEHENDRS